MFKLILAPLLAKKTFEVLSRQAIMVRENIRVRMNQKETKNSLTPIARYKLVPDLKGTYSLDKWQGSFIGYITIQEDVTPEQADESIKNIERDVIYIA